MTMAAWGRRRRRGCRPRARGRRGPRAAPRRAPPAPGRDRSYIITIEQHEYLLIIQTYGHHVIYIKLCSAKLLLLDPRAGAPGDPRGTDPRGCRTLERAEEGRGELRLGDAAARKLAALRQALANARGSAWGPVMPGCCANRIARRLQRAQPKHR